MQSVKKDLYITGTGFSAGNVQVFFNGVPGLDLEVVNDTTLLVTVPPTLSLDPADITVTTAGGTTSLPNGFTVIGTITTIPTLSEWGILLLVGALFGAGIHQLRNKDYS